MKGIFKNKIFHLFFIVLVTALVYSNSLSNGLVWDDHLFIENWKDIKSVKNLPYLLAGSAPEGQGKIYRPVRSILYLIDYQLWGADPFYYHLQALLLHLGVTVFIYLVIEAMFMKDIKASELKIFSIPLFNRSVPFIASLLFGLHPIHTETIDYIAASLETWGSLFFFISFYCYIKTSTVRSNHLVASKTNKYFIASIVFAALAFFTYEMTLTLPILIVLYDLCFKKLKINKNNLDRILRHFFPYFALAALFLFVRVGILGITSRNEYLGYSFYLTMLVMIKVFLRYVYLLFVPISLSANHNLVADFPVSMLTYDKLDPILNQSIFDLDVLFAILVLGSLFYLAFYYFRRNSFVTFCLGWFFISLLPVSYIIPHGAAMAEKFLYIPSFGFVFLFAVFIQAVFLKKTIGWIRIIFVIGVVVFYSFFTFNRNKVWRDDIALFSDMVNSSKNSLIGNYTLGVRYGEKEDFTRAASYYLKVISKAPDFWEAHFNLGNIYLKQGKEDLAKEEYKKVLILEPDFAPAQDNLKKVQN